MCRSCKEITKLYLTPYGVQWLNTTPDKVIQKTVTYKMKTVCPTAAPLLDTRSMTTTPTLRRHSSENSVFGYRLDTRTAMNNRGNRPQMPNQELPPVPGTPDEGTPAGGTLNPRLGHPTEGHTMGEHQAEHVHQETARPLLQDKHRT